MYKVILVYFNNHLYGKRVIHRGLTESQAQELCSNPETSSRTCTKPYLKHRTKVKGPWFLCYDKE